LSVEITVAPVDGVAETGPAGTSPVAISPIPAAAASTAFRARHLFLLLSMSPSFVAVPLT
jgi:hypothetical protein